MKKRFFEIDVLRGVAVVLMIVFHFLFDLDYFDILQLSMYSGFLGFFQKVIASSFFVLVGICLTFGNKKKAVFRGFKIFLLGMLITIFTYLFFREEFIFFGVLHFIGISLVLSSLFFRFRYVNLVLGILFVLFGLVFSVNSYFLFWLGYYPVNTFDYFPLLPWFGVVLIGMFIGRTSYSKDRENNNRRNKKHSFLVPLEYVGKKSLIIYFVHQPVLFLILKMFF